jgi:hypothetical protein
MNIKVGEYEVYSSGTIVSLPEEIIQFYIEDLTYELEFKDDLTKSEQNVEAIADSKTKTMKLVFTNFNNNLGTGSLNPLNLGFIGKKILYFNYRVYALVGNKDSGTAGKTLHYTWLTKDRQEVENG